MLKLVKDGEGRAVNGAYIPARTFIISDDKAKLEKVLEKLYEVFSVLDYEPINVPYIKCYDMPENLKDDIITDPRFLSSKGDYDYDPNNLGTLRLCYGIYIEEGQYFTIIQSKGTETSLIRGLYNQIKKSIR